MRIPRQRSGTVEPAAPACWTEVSGLPKFGFVLLSCARFSAPEVENKARNTNPINTTAVASTRNALLRSMLFCPRVLISARFGRLRSSWIRRQICCTMPPEAAGLEAALGSDAGSSALVPIGFTRLVIVGSSCSISSRSGFSSRMPLSSVISHLSKTANAETNWSQGRAIHCTRLGHLKEKRLIRLLERRTLEDHHAVGALARS